MRWKSYTPLMLATIRGSLDCVRQLIEAGGDIAATDEQSGATLLHFAAKSGNADLVRYVLPLSELERTDRKNRTAMMWACMTESPAFNEQVVDVLLEAGAKVDSVDNSGWAPFTALAANGHFNAVKMLVERGNSVHFTTPDNVNLLYHAAELGHTEMTHWLLSKGVDCNIASVRGTEEIGETPVFVAAEYGHLEVMRLLIGAGANIHHKTRSGITPLAIALRNGRTNIVRHLVRRGAEATRTDLEDVAERDCVDLVVACIACGYEFDQDVLAETTHELPFFALYLAGAPIDETKCRAIRDNEKAFDELSQMGLLLVNDRATEICIALQALELPALQTLMVIDVACPLAYMLPMSVKWRLVTLIKHFKQATD
jgi:ankyrin repeat protein